MTGHSKIAGKDIEAVFREEMRIRDAAHDRLIEDKLREKGADVKKEVDQLMIAVADEERQRIRDRLLSKDQDMLDRKKQADKTMREAAAQLRKLDGASSAKSIVGEEALARRDGYIILRTEIGRGSRAVIYKAINPAKQAIACKVSTIRNLQGSGRIRYMESLKVIRFLVHVPHVNVLSTEEIFSSPEKIYVFCPATKEDLNHKVAGMVGGFSEAEALRIGRQVAEGVAFLHSLGIAHERLRPGHVLFDEHNVVKIGGLGWLVPFFDQEKNRILMRTGSAKTRYLSFYAPEVLVSDPYDPSVADIWSLGILLVIMQTRDWPFEKQMRHPYHIAFQLCFKKAGVRMGDDTYKLLDKCFQVEPCKRANIFELLAAFPASSAAARRTVSTKTEIN